ncbi:MAG: hypothetical protein AB1480_14315 [Nitrospirota bacterium]
MKSEYRIRLLIPIILVFVFFLACDQKPKNPVSEYGDALIGAYKRGQRAGEEANLDTVKKSIEAYHAANDRYPQNLDEIKDLIGSNIDISRYDYNPDNGRVSLKK